MISIPYTEKEKNRIAKLIELNILDTPEEDDFNDIVKLASQICEVPISLISLVDDTRQWFKAKVGLAASETPREWAFCAHAVDSNSFLQVEDATKDVRFFDNPLVVGSPDIRFYAGYPLKTSDNIALGTLCVIDTKPKELNQFQVNALETLANQVIKNIELRLSNKHLAQNLQTIAQQNVELDKANDTKRKLISILSHDLRSPLSNLQNFIYLFENNALDANEQKEILNGVKSGVNSTINMMENLLTWTMTQLRDNSIHITQLKPCDIVKLQSKSLKLNADRKGITIINNIDENLFVNADAGMLEFIIRNLISNAIKFSNNSNIEVKLTTDENYDIISIKDYGIGMNSDTKSKMFKWDTENTKLGTNNEKGTGLGLLVVKDFIDKMNGIIEFESEENKGTTFYIKLLTANGCANGCGTRGISAVVQVGKCVG